jgi:quercetin dioxygenase-like cupin family protein
VWPPLPTLLRIAMVFGVGLDHFFNDERNVVGVVRSEERQKLEQTMGERVAFRFQSLDYSANERKTSAWLAEFEQVPEEEAAPHEHQGSEFIFVLSGKLRIVIGRQEIELAKGDSIYFESHVPHWYSRIGSGRCEAIVVTA